MLEKPIITLTTDFGLKDPFVGIMKGVISEINPRANIIDISHNIAPQNIIEAAEIISMSYKYFSPTAIHVVVVDPGVGSSRRPLLVVTEDHYFIGPDNGVFTQIFEEPHTNIFKVISISASHYYLPFRGPTFHGRDIFAPIAAWLSRGVESSRFGEPIKDYAAISIPKPEAINKTSLEGEVVYIDSFGNAITNITEGFLEKFNPKPAKEKIVVLYKDKKMRLSNYYAEDVTDNISAIINSFGRLELFIYKGPASDKFKIKIGDKIKITLKKDF
jgi:S-adenosylmethionine hydrolase